MVKKVVKKIINNKESEVRDYNVVLMEKIYDEVRLLAKCQTAFREEVDARFNKVDKKFNQIDARFDQVDVKFSQIDAKFDQIEVRFDEMDSCFQTVFEYLSRFENELAEIKAKLENKADKKELAAIEQRVLKMELELGECKKLIAAAKKS